MKKIWPFSFYFLYFTALSALMPFFVLFYQRLGFSGAQIGLLTGIPPLITLVAAPFWTGVADAKRWHKLVMGMGIMVAVLSVFLLPSFTSFFAIFILIIVFNVFVSPVAALADSATMNMLGEERAMYGRIRLGGTIGWGLFAPIAGAIVQNYGLKLAFWSYSAIMLVNFFVSQRFVHRSHEESTSKPGGLRVLLKKRRWINFLFIAFLGGLGTFAANAYLFPYMAELGAKETIMGFALTISTLTEMPIFFFGDRLVKRFTAYGLLTLALVMVAVRSLLLAAVSTPLMVLVLQAFGGMIFPAMWLAGVSYADENAPAGLKSSAQGLFGAMSFGFGSAVGGFMGGLLLESVGGRGMFLIFGVIVLVGLVIAEAIRRFFPDKNELSQVVASD
ncbi:MAG TPA: major facilitator superfamily domain-containing protein 6 [Anaerolineales bacterium]|nr:major facilitator superfamily domain-containing protein 6 [Anaerolineales bacterium]